ncbi:unnamed protein product [Meloidogyne enterolobii]|uniref:Uncharacterized protein n=1 Tax=Meloidogyne enterolobii TaxID=390850 RepID=A0ACB0Y8F9_MELEN
MSTKLIIPIILIILLILPEGECDCVQMCKNSACSQICSRKKREGGGDEGVKRLIKRDFNGCQFTQMGGLAREDCSQNGGVVVVRKEGRRKRLANLEKMREGGDFP